MDLSSSELYFYALALGFHFSLSFYLASVLQIVSYKPKRLLFHFPKRHWHLYYFFFPLIGFVISAATKLLLLALVVFILHLASLVFWYYKMDKKLVTSPRIKRLGFILLLCGPLFGLAHAFVISQPHVLDSLLFCFALSYLIEHFINKGYLRKAAKKLKLHSELKIIMITASYGKTSMKYMLAHFLQDSKTHFAKGSVNTLLGVAKDINNNLPIDAQFYVVEAGAREVGDVKELCELLKPQYVIVGEVGSAHLEYFKSREAILKEKLEALNSPRLTYAMLHGSSCFNLHALKHTPPFTLMPDYDDLAKGISATLEGLSFFLGKNEQIYHSKLLGAFNAQNIAAAYYMAKFLGVKKERLDALVPSLEAVEHRLKVLQREPKFIIDDGFNGNLSGMSSSYLLCQNYKKGKRVLVSPGILEASTQDNVLLCEQINECFDLVILTASSNASVFSQCINIDFLLVSKDELLEVLEQQTGPGDLVLFSNDAPSFY